MSEPTIRVIIPAGAGTPLTRRGRAIAYRPPPWRMRGRTLALWYLLADPDEARRHVPDLLAMDPDPVVRVRFWDMVHDACGPATTAGAGDAPTWTRFREAVVAFPVRYDGVEGDYPTYMYADEFAYTAFGREVMGWPVRGGVIDVDPEPPGGPVGALRIGGRLRREGRELLRAELMLTGESRVDEDPHPPRWLASKVITDVARPSAVVAQLVATGPERIHRREIWQATGDLAFGEGPADELHFLAPRQVVEAQYWANVDLTVGWGEVLAELGDQPWTHA